MKTKMLILYASAFVVFVVNSVISGPIRDQYNPPDQSGCSWVGFDYGTWRAQTFQHDPNKPPYLKAVRFYKTETWDHFGDGNDIVCQIQTTSGGAPTGTVLASTTYTTQDYNSSQSSLPNNEGGSYPSYTGWAIWELDEPIDISSYTTSGSLAIVWGPQTSGMGEINVQLGGSNTEYSGGTAFVSYNQGSSWYCHYKDMPFEVLTGYHQDSFREWPLRNGDFTNYQAFGRPADWGTNSQTGNDTFNLDPTPTGFLNSPSIAEVNSAADSNGCYWQDVNLLPGSYTLHTESSGDSGKKIWLRVGDELIADVNSTWQPFEVDFNMTSAGSERMHLYAYSTPTAGEVRFQNAWIEIKQIDASDGNAIELTTGEKISGIRIPVQPTLAEEYACYELQRYVYQITGKILGLQGRDTVHDANIWIDIGNKVDGGYRTTLNGLSEDGYIVGVDANGIHLAGKNDIGTLYAVYDFLIQQGCGWYMIESKDKSGSSSSGGIGEVIPTATDLTCCSVIVEDPDYDGMRTYCVVTQDFLPTSGWIRPVADDCIDFALRNRFNTCLTDSGTYLDFGAYRGRGRTGQGGHTFNTHVLVAHDEIDPVEDVNYFTLHPEWFAYVDGARRGYSWDIPPHYFATQYCVSDPNLRDEITYILEDYFDDSNNSESSSFSVSIADGPTYFCECSLCAALDPNDPNSRI